MVDIVVPSRYNEQLAQGKILHRTFAIALSIFFCSQMAFGYTFVFKNGKKIEGTVLFEDSSTLRILEKTGLNMSLNKSMMDFVAMEKANQKSNHDQPPVATIPTEPVRKPAKRVRTWTSPVSSYVEPTNIHQAEREFMRLAQACRAAGTGPSVKKVLKTNVYYVNGKRVSKTGYWAHPSSIETAKQICRKAMEAEARLRQARKASAD